LRSQSSAQFLNLLSTQGHHKVFQSVTIQQFLNFKKYQLGRIHIAHKLIHCFCIFDLTFSNGKVVILWLAIWFSIASLKFSTRGLKINDSIEVLKIIAMVLNELTHA
jgi:hypothetical protein